MLPLPTTLRNLFIDPMKATSIAARVIDLLIKVLELFHVFKPHVVKELWLRAFPNVFDTLCVDIASVTCANRLSSTYIMDGESVWKTRYRVVWIVRILDADSMATPRDLFDLLKCEK